MTRLRPRSAKVTTAVGAIGSRRWLGPALVASLLACQSGSGPGTATPATARSLAGADAPAAPAGGLAFPDLDLPWTPPMATAGDLEALVAALARVPAVTLRLGPRMAGPGWDERGTEIVAALSPTTRVVAWQQGSLYELLAASPALQSPARSLGPGGRPRYASAGLRSSWLAGQDAPLLAIDDATLRASDWQALPAVSIGSCDAPMQALAEGQELALVQLGPFLDRADAALEKRYRQALVATLPGLLAELAAIEARQDLADDGPRATQQCSRDYRRQVEAARCDDEGPCRAAPRLVLLGGLRIAAPEPGPPVAGDCAARVGRDYTAELRGLARMAARSTSEALARDWVVLADRLGTLSEVHAALEDICTPRRRRFTEVDLTEARRRLARIGRALASDERRGEGHWQIVDEPLHVPGLGPGHELARFVAGPSSINAGIVADARALREFVIAHGRCRASHGSTPLTVLLALPGSSEVAFFGYFYEEELYCDALPPLGLTPT